MAGLAMCIIFILACLLGYPIAAAALLSSLAYMLMGSGIHLQILTQVTVNGMNQYSLLAIPMFVLAGNIMNFGGVTRRIFRFCSAMIGHIPGGLGQVNVLASMIFAGMSGSGTADAAGLGKIEIEAMNQEGYDIEFTAGVTAASACIGPIIPPSIPAVVYAVQAGISTGALFAAGMVPGILMGLAQMVMCYVIGKRRGYFQPKASGKVRRESFVESIPALFAPILIIGGSFSGIFTPTEAAAVTVLYGFIVGKFIYKELHWKDMKAILWDTAETTAVLMIIVGAVSTFGWVLVRELVPQSICTWIMGLSNNPTIVMLLLLLFFLVVGCFITPSAAILVLVPILKPLMSSLNIHPLQFGMLVVYTLCIGNVTPPVGNVLYITARVAEIPSERMMRAMVPWYIPLLALALLIVFIPQLSSWLPSLLNYS